MCYDGGGGGKNYCYNNNVSKKHSLLLASVLTIEYSMLLEDLN